MAYFDGWSRMPLDKLLRILSTLPSDAVIWIPSPGNLSIMDTQGGYVGYVDLSFEERFIPKDEVEMLAARNIEPMELG